MVCGDGRIDGSEQCDDHNLTAGDGCGATCLLEDGWQCPTVNARCVAKCGDSLIVGVEGCDDGNAVGSDGCSATCQVEPGFACSLSGGKSVCHATTCGDGKPEGSEQCDDGNNRPFDGCYKCLRDPQCTAGVCKSVCGDGQRYADEACDDGNTANGDGCSSTCKIETGYACSDVTGTPPASINLPVLFRDFVGQGRTKNGHAAHIDFNQLNGNGVLGIVESNLDAQGRARLCLPEQHPPGQLTQLRERHQPRASLHRGAGPTPQHVERRQLRPVVHRPPRHDAAHGERHQRHGPWRAGAHAADHGRFCRGLSVR